MRTKHAYRRKGAEADLVAWDGRHAKIDGRCADKTGIGSFSRLMTDLRIQHPYRSARRVFRIMDNGAPCGQACIDRLNAQWPTVVPVHTPVG